MVLKSDLYAAIKVFIHVPEYVTAKNVRCKKMPTTIKKELVNVKIMNHLSSFFIETAKKYASKHILERKYHKSI